MKTLTLLGTTLGLSFTAGLNLYATVFVTGLALRLRWLELPSGLEGLSVLAHPAVLAVAGLLYVVEFLADKIPAVDHVWDAVHTFVRPLGAVLLTWTAVSGAHLPETLELPLLLLAGGVTLSTHAGKAGTRLVSTATGAHGLGAGVGLSLLEDVAAVSIAPLALAHPLAALVVVLLGLALLALVAPLGFRFLRSRVAALDYLLEHKLLDRRLTGLGAPHLPEPVALALAEAGVRPGDRDLVLPACASSLPGIPRWAPGFLALGPDGAVFACRGWFRTRTARVSFADARPVLVDRPAGYLLQAATPRGRATFTFFPLTAPMAEALERAVARYAGGSLEPARAPGIPARDVPA